MLKLVAFTGKKTSGKTLSADYLVKKYGFIKVNFKDALIDEVKEKFPRTMGILVETYGRKDIDDLFSKPYPRAIRSILEEYGTEVVRDVDVNHWVKKWRERLDTTSGNQIVVDDVRFENEANEVKKFNGKIIRISRNVAVDKDKHRSETVMDMIPFDLRIDNNGTKKDLYANLDAVIEIL